MHCVTQAQQWLLTLLPGTFCQQMRRAAPSPLGAGRGRAYYHGHTITSLAHPSGAAGPQLLFVAAEASLLCGSLLVASTNLSRLHAARSHLLSSLQGPLLRQWLLTLLPGRPSDPGQVREWLLTLLPYARICVCRPRRSLLSAKLHNSDLTRRQSVVPSPAERTP